MQRRKLPPLFLKETYRCPAFFDQTLFLQHKERLTDGLAADAIRFYKFHFSRKTQFAAAGKTVYLFF